MKTLVKTKALIDCTGADPIENGWFLVENGRIAAVGKPGESAPAGGAEETIDFSDRYVMAGMIDAHDHFGLSHRDRLEPLTVEEQLKLPGQRKVCKAMLYVREHIQAGVTMVRDMGEDDFIDFDLKRAIDEGYFPGPRILPCGAFISPTHGHGQTGQTVSDGVEGVRKTARLNLSKGAAHLKVFGSGGVVTGQGGLGFCTSTLDEFKTAVQEAEMLGKYVATHVHGGPGIDLCLDAGVRSFEHATLATDEQIERIKKLDRWVTITFCPMFHPAGLHDLDPVKKARLDLARETYCKTVEKMMKAGVNLCMGTDGVHGAMPFEAQWMEKCGASRMQAICYMTREAAKSCRMEQDVGTLEAGKFADFIALEQNPLDDLKNLECVKAVYVGGKKMA